MFLEIDGILYNINTISEIRLDTGGELPAVVCCFNNNTFKKLVTGTEKECRKFYSNILFKLYSNDCLIEII